MKKIIILISLLFLLTSTSVHAQMYKWTDENGQTHFSDKPHKTAKKIKINKSGKVNVQTTSAIQPQTQTKSQPNPSKSTRIKLRKLLKQRNFKKLNKILSELDESFKKDIKNEQHLFSAYETFFIKKESYESLFNDWVEATPDSHIPYLARAKYFYAMAWKVRGNDYSSETPKKQKYKMLDYLKRAMEDIRIPMNEKKPPILAFELLLRIAKLQGHDDLKDAFKAVIKIYPATFNYRNIYLSSLTPRWGGSYEKMQNFIEETQQYVKLNPRLKFLESAIYLDKGAMLSLKKEYELASLMFNSSIGFGDYSEAYFERGENYVRLKQYKKAISSLTKSISLNSEMPLYYYWRANAYIGLEMFDKAANDLKFAAKLDPYDKSIKNRNSWLANKLYKQAYDTQNNGDTLSTIEKYTKAIKFDPNNGNLYNQRSRAYYDQRKHALALKDIKKAIEVEPDRYNHYLMLDFLVVRTNKDWPLIIRYWNKYIDLKPDDARAYAEVAGTYYHNRDINSAKKYAKKSADMGNNDGIEIFNRLKNL